MRVGAAGGAVVGRLGDHVGEVDALAEHVAGDGRFGRRDAQALAQDAGHVGDARAVPQQPPVRQLRERPVARRLALALHLEHLQPRTHTPPIHHSSFVFRDTSISLGSCTFLKKKLSSSIESLACY